jgi:hypothetical protein
MYLHPRVFMRSDAQEGSSGKGAAKEKSSGSKPRRLTVFSGFVSYDQLEQKLLGDQKKGPRWLHRNVEGPHPVRMRGPGIYCVSFGHCGCAVHNALVQIAVG